MRTILIVGGSGFVGRELAAECVREGWRTVVASRDPVTAEKTAPMGVTVLPLQAAADIERTLGDCPDALVNLAGENLQSGRWTEERKRAILSSRVETTRELVASMSGWRQAPGVLVNASAIGFYGTDATRVWTENDPGGDSDFLADVVRRWETEAIRAEELGVRVVLARFGVILGRGGGALGKLALPYRLGIGGTVGSGEQWVSWVHMRDVVRMVLWSIDEKGIEGPLNVTAPQPVTMRALGRAMARVTGRPHWLTVPAIALRLVFGEMASLMLEGQRVLPQKAVEQGYAFYAEEIDAALRDLLGVNS